MFEYHFDGTMQQFKKVGYPFEGAPSNFINFSMALDDLPEEAFGKWYFCGLDFKLYKYNGFHKLSYDPLSHLYL